MPKQSDMSLRPRAKRGGQQPCNTNLLVLHEARHSPAFTLIELLVVIGVIAILAGILLPAAMQAWGRAYVEKAKSQLASLEVALEMYKTDLGYYPLDDTALGTEPTTCRSMIKALTTSSGSSWHGPYMSFKKGDLDADDPTNANLNDPWGKPWRYNNVGNNTGGLESNTHNKPGKFDLSSWGADGLVGGTGNDADIINW